jgi:FtsH-binding integral membrane protein
VALLTQCFGPFAALDEANMLAGTLLCQLFVATASIVVLKLGSSQVLFFTGLSQCAALIYVYFTGKGRHTPLSMYMIWQLTPLLIGTEVTLAIFDFFVPLVSSLLFPISSFLTLIKTGRIGKVRYFHRRKSSNLPTVS